MTTYKLGWIPDVPDHRDRILPAALFAKRLPKKKDLRDKCPPIWDQGRIGSCTAHAAGAAHLFEQLQKRASYARMPSRLYLYYFARELQGWQAQDSGAYIRDCFKILGQRGVSDEALWPYIESRVAKRPTSDADADAQNRQAISYARVNADERSICGAVAAGNLVVFGAMLYGSFMTEWRRTGVIPMPGKNESAVGGHAMAIVGYDRDRKIYIVRNSWGVGNPMSGYHTMPFAYLHDRNLCDDFWTMSNVEV